MDAVTYRRAPYHVHAIQVKILSRGMARGLLAAGTFLELSVGHFCKYGQIHFPPFESFLIGLFKESSRF